jgi:hypothetical protein
MAIRAAALEALLVEKGLISTDAIDAVVDLYENDVGPQNGARVVARAWVDPAYKQRLLTEGTAAWASAVAGTASGSSTSTTVPRARTIRGCTRTRRYTSGVQAAGSLPNACCEMPHLLFRISPSYPKVPCPGSKVGKWKHRKLTRNALLGDYSRDVGVTSVS